MTTSRRRHAYLLVTLVDALGTGMFLPISVLFFVQSRGLDATSVGLSLAIATLLALAAAPVAATLIQKWGAGWAAAADYGVTALAYAAYPFVSTTSQFFVAVFATRLASQWARPAHLVLADDVGGAAGRVRLLSTGRALRNVGMAVGSGVAAVVLSAGDGTLTGRVLIGLDVASYVIAAALTLRFLPLAAGRHRASGPAHRPPSWRDVRSSPVYLRASLVALLLTPQTPLLVVALPLTLAPVTSLSGTLTAIALAANTALVAALQVVAGKESEHVVGAVRALRRGALLLAASCLVMALVRPGTSTVVVYVLVGGFVLTNTAAELWISAGSWGTALGLAPHASPRHLTFFSSVESVGTAVGTGLAATLVADKGAGGWLLFAVLAALALLLTVSLTPGTPQACQRSRNSPGLRG